MCGIAGAFGFAVSDELATAMLENQRHRGPDAQRIWRSHDRNVVLLHNRLKIIDLSEAANQPMQDSETGNTIVFNGEIYNYLELKERLRTHYSFKTDSDTEVILAAYREWGEECVHRFLGMFSFAIWNQAKREMFCVRDRFGVKPFYCFQNGSGFVFASELGTIRQALPRWEYDETAILSYLKEGWTDGHERTFCREISSLPPGSWLKIGEFGRKAERHQYYDFAKSVGEKWDERSDEDVREEYFSLLEESMRLRLRSDVPVGTSLSSGLDSSLLFAGLQKVQPDLSKLGAFTYTCGHPDYDESEMAKTYVEKSGIRFHRCELSATEVPQLAERFQEIADGPFGGLPTLAYCKVFEVAKRAGFSVILDGQGLDEAWAGYDYYRQVSQDKDRAKVIIQGTKDPVFRSDLLDVASSSSTASIELESYSETFASDPLRERQYLDLCYSKIPRALRFSDRVSMLSSVELREPFLDHRLVELAFRQPAFRKVSSDQGKIFLRHHAESWIRHPLTQSKKRPVQTPQREWMRGELKNWVLSSVSDLKKSEWSGLFRWDGVDRYMKDFFEGRFDNSVFAWQLVNLNLIRNAWARPTRKSKTVPNASTDRAADLHRM